MQITRAPRRHLAVSDLLDCTRACPVCLTEASRKAVFRLQSDPDVWMLACPHCRASSASHMPRPEVLESYYAHYYAGSTQEVTFSEPARFARHIVRMLTPGAFAATTRILDFGGGDGSLARAVAERLLSSGRTEQVEIVVVDYLEREAVAGSNLGIRFQSPAEPFGGPYQLVLASAILEHVPELHALLHKLMAALATGGFFYARTPYSVPLARLFPRIDLVYPAHVHDLGSPFWNRLRDTFPWSVRVLASRPSLVAGSIGQDPLRTLAAVALKIPAHIESALSPPDRRTRLWHFAGGWEVLLQQI